MFHVTIVKGGEDYSHANEVWLHLGIVRVAALWQEANSGRPVKFLHTKLAKKKKLTDHNGEISQQDAQPHSKGGICHREVRQRIKRLGSLSHTHILRLSVADAAVHRTQSSICLCQRGSGGPSRPANQSLSPPILQRSSWLHRAECRAQSAVPIIAISAEPRQIPAHHLNL